MPDATESRPAVARTCPRCGAPVEPDQLVCLECGAPVGIGWRRPARAWIAVATVVGVVLLAGVVLAVALTRIGDEADEAASRPSPTQGLTTTQPGVPPPGAGRGEGGGAAEEPLARWPEGRNAFTVVLLNARTRSGAVRRARQAQEKRIDAGVLDTDDYSSLPAARWFTFAGSYESEEEADAAAARYGERGFEDAGVEFVNGADSPVRPGPDEPAPTATAPSATTPPETPGTP